MKKNYTVLFSILSILTASAADNIVCSPSGSACQLIDASGNHWNAKIGFTTDGNGDIFTLGDVASTDNILGQNPSGNRTLIDNLSRRWSASVLYTTDGSGHVIPVPTGGGGGSVTAVTGTAPVVSSGGSTPAISMAAATNSVNGYLTSADHTTFAAKQSTSYSPATSSNWGVAPSSVVGALDAIASADALNTYRVDKSGHDSATCGSDLNPCLTISQALTNIGVSATAADVKNAKTVIIGAGAYDESLTIPSGRIISLIAQGMVVLGDGAGTNWASTTPRNIAWNPQAADLHGSDVKPALTIGTIAPADATSTFIAESQNFTISGNLTMNGDGTTKTLNLHGVKIWGNISHTDASLVNWQSYRSLVVGTVSTTGNLVLERAYDSRFNGLLSVNAVNMAFDSNFLGGITVQSIQQNILPNGMFHCNIGGTFTGPASSYRVDLETDFQSAPTLAGGATKVLLANNASSTVTGALSSTDWSTFNGKFSLPALTSGSVLFSNGSTIAQDNGEFFWDDTNFQLSLGGHLHTAALGISQTGGSSVGFDLTTSTANTAAQIENQGAQISLELTTAAASATQGGTLALASSRGTNASRVASNAGDQIGVIVGQSYNGSSFGPGFSGAIGFIATETPTSAHNGAEIVFAATPNTTLTPIPSVVVDQSGTLEPFADNTTPLGTTSLRWKDAHFSSVIQMGVQGSGVTPACATANKGTLALTSTFILCVCNGSSFVKTADGTTACTF